MKKILLACLTLALVLCLLPLQAKAATGSGTCGYNLTWTLDNSGTLTISGTGEMYGYYYTYQDDAPWMLHNIGIKTVIIEDGVTTIGDGAFQRCQNLTSVTIPGSVTNIGISAFEECDALTSVTIPDSVTTIGRDAFSSCDGLTSVSIPGSVTNISYSAFWGCTALTSVTIGQGVTTIEKYAFSSCTALEEITIPASMFSIEDDAFKDVRLKTVRYTGPKEKWDKINLNNNGALFAADLKIVEEPTAPASCNHTGYLVVIIVLSLALGASIAALFFLRRKKNA